MQHIKTNGLIVVRYDMEIWDKLWAVVGHYRYNRTIIKQLQEALGFIIVITGIDMHRRGHQNVIIRLCGQVGSKEPSPLVYVFWVYGFTGVIKTITNIIIL